jgi:hypothetical protein
LGLQYGTLWLSGKLFNPLPDPGFVPLSTIVVIQFVPLSAIAAIIATFTWRRTLQPARRPDLRAPGHLVCGGGHGDPGGVLERFRAKWAPVRMAIKFTQIA